MTYPDLVTGPIVRINPFELHIDDPDFYETIYTASPPYDRIKEHENKFNMPYATFSTVDGALHKSRRAALNPFFSKGRIQSRGPTIQSLTDKVLDRIIKKYGGTNKELTLNDMFGCLIGDIIMDLAFSHSYNMIETEDFKHPFTESTKETVGMVHWVTHLPWIVPLTNAFNEDLLMSLAPALKPIILFRRVRYSILHSVDKLLIQGLNIGNVRPDQRNTS